MIPKNTFPPDFIMQVRISLFCSWYIWCWRMKCHTDVGHTDVKLSWSYWCKDWEFLSIGQCILNVLCRKKCIVKCLWLEAACVACHQTMWVKEVVHPLRSVPTQNAPSRELSDTTTLLGWWWEEPSPSHPSTQQMSQCSPHAALKINVCRRGQERRAAVGNVTPIVRPWSGLVWDS